MVNLIRNENMKLYRRWRTWVMVGFMIAAVLVGSFVEWYYDSSDASWRNDVIEQQQDMQAVLSDPELDPESQVYYKDQLAIIDYRLTHDIRPEPGTMWDGINGSASLFILITLFTVIVAGDSLAGEFTAGTIKLLLIRPASRLKILISKYLSMILFGFGLLIILFVVSVLVNGLLYQFKAIDLPLLTVNGEGVVVEKSMVANLWQTYLLNGVSTIIFVTMAFMISSAFRSSAMAIGISIFSLFAGTIVLELLQRYEWSKYLLFANLDLSQYLSGRPYQDGMTLSFSVIVLALYFILFNLVSWLVFTRRDVAA
ncbi:ABC-2 type transport system permease protein [Paenibacillus phyllosphaerae]|uniref:ABC-2 type transport system permease protein n=1 Tax=Paenibacillus phyllosphaerae TaxID=274593 RepID=A0A7W5AYI7_9BACL|nr:ABC transporter permease [Paenibacillus phyllosphaerae]MBB3111082.1 ABC-2 type transport system permease protein [Paenibacillus phyllosphaerae]